MMSVRHSRRTIVLAAILILAATVGAIVVAQLLPGSQTNLKQALEKAGVTLLFGAILGGVAKLLLDNFELGRVQRGEQAQFVSNVLDDLKQVYDRVESARILLPAHKSAKTYGDEMRALIPAQVQLRNVKRALAKDSLAMEEPSRKAVSQHIERMEVYLESLTHEFRDNYKRIADKQRAYEARVSTQLKAEGQAAATSGEGGFPNEAWEDVTRLPRLADFIGLNSVPSGDQDPAVLDFQRDFVGPLDDATQCLRDELRRIIGA